MESGVSSVVFRRGEPGDLNAVAALESAVFQIDRLSRRSLSRFLKSPAASLLVAMEEVVLHAYALTAFRRGSKIARVYSIAVAPHASGRGLGRALMAASEQDARERGAQWMQLEVRPDNVAALRLYRAMGYEEFGRYEDYYEDDTAALRLRKWLG
jgi:ribosomal protein S18 acetylase RimI-like enzyme